MAEGRVGAIDIGTNTVLLLVAEGPRHSPVPLLERATITRLGKGVDRTRHLSAEGIERTIRCLAAYADDLKNLGVTRTVAVCTSAARDADNGAEFLDQAQRTLGTAPRIVDGTEEAALVFDGALTGLSVDGPVTVFDIGGGSTEVIRGARAGGSVTLESSVSMDIGSVRLTERHVRCDPPTLPELEAIARDVDVHLATSPLEASRTLVGVAGTMTTLAAIDLQLSTYDPAVVHGARLRKRNIEDILARLSQMPLDERRRVEGLDPARADVIIAGTLIALRLMEHASIDEVIVSDRGVRWGLAKSAL